MRKEAKRENHRPQRTWTVKGRMARRVAVAVGGGASPMMLENGGIIGGG